MKLWAIFRAVVFLVLLGAAAWQDVQNRKIRNPLILLGILLGLLTAIPYGLSGVGDALTGGIIALVVGFLFWKLRVFRAGDAKLLWVVGCFSGTGQLLQDFAAILLVSGVCALFLMLRHGVLLQKFKRVGLHLNAIAVQRRFEAYEPEEGDVCSFPFAVGVFGGQLAYFIWLMVR